LADLGELFLHIGQQTLLFFEYAPSFSFRDWIFHLELL
jgi:hypothetical protein